MSTTTWNFYKYDTYGTTTTSNVKTLDFGTNSITFTTTVSYDPTFLAPVFTPETEEVPIIREPTTKIKPSEAIRLGRLIRPRETKTMLFSRSDGGCTLGAMLEGWGIASFVLSHGVFNTQLKSFLEKEYGESADQVHRIINKIPGWYDSGTKTEPQIIEYLESIGL